MKKRIWLMALIVAVLIVRAAGQTYVGSVEATTTTGSTVSITSGGDWSATDSFAGSVATASAHLDGMFGTANLSVSTGGLWHGATAAVSWYTSDELTVTASGYPNEGAQGVAVLRYSLGEISGTKTGNAYANASLSLTGTTSGSYLFSAGVGSSFTSGIVEFQHTFNFGQSFTVSQWFNATTSTEQTNTSASLAFAGVQFLGIASVRDALTDLPVSEFAISSLSGADYNLAAVPEPSSVAAVLGAVGGLVALVARRKRTRSCGA